MMKQRIFAVILTLLLISAVALSPSAMAEDVPEIDITWLSVSGRPWTYNRKDHVLELTEYHEGGAIKHLDLDSGEIISGFVADIWDQVPISFAHRQVRRKRNSDSSPMGLCVANEEFKYGFVNMAGELIIPCEYDWINPSDHAESFAVLGDGGYGFVDSSNELIVTFGWGYAEGFFESRSVVARCDESGNEKCGYIDLSGKLVIPLEYDFATSFHEGLAVVGRKDMAGDIKWGYIDPYGKVVIPLAYDCCTNFEAGIAAVGQKDWAGDVKWGCIDSSGNVVIPLEYENEYGYQYDSEFILLGNFPDVGGKDGLVILRKDGKYGCFNASGEVVLPMEYDDMDYLGDGMFMVQKGASYGIFESPYWGDSQFTPSPHSEQEETHPMNAVFRTATIFLAISACAVGLFLVGRKKADD